MKVNRLLVPSYALPMTLSLAHMNFNRLNYSVHFQMENHYDLNAQSSRSTFDITSRSGACVCSALAIDRLVRLLTLVHLCCFVGLIRQCAWLHAEHFLIAAEIKAISTATAATFQTAEFEEGERTNRQMEKRNGERI